MLRKASMQPQRYKLGFFGIELPGLVAKSMEVGSPAIDRPEPFTQSKPRDAETIALQLPDKRAVQNKCKSYVK
jgi:hypothetical protein